MINCTATRKVDEGRGQGRRVTEADLPAKSAAPDVSDCAGDGALPHACSTDGITGDVAAWAGAIVTSYVGGRSLEKIATSISAIWSRK